MSGAGHGAEPMARQWQGACRARNALQNPRVVWPSAALNKPSIRAGHGSMWRGYRKQGHMQWCWGPAGRQTELLPAGWAPPGPQQHQSGAGRWHLPHLSPQLPRSRTRATVRAVPSTHVPSPGAGSGRDHRVNYTP